MRSVRMKFFLPEDMHITDEIPVKTYILQNKNM